jgi:hypothetical protein
VVQALIGNKADLNIKNRKGRSALSAAQDDAIRRMLETSGAR